MEVAATIKKDKEEQQRMKRILQMYGEGSCWNGYESRIKSMRMAQYCKAGAPLMTKQIVQETVDQSMSLLVTPRVG